MRGRPGWVFKRRHMARAAFKKRQIATAIDALVACVIEKRFELTSDGKLKIKSTPPPRSRQ
jgi:hypothetical protein